MKKSSELERSTIQNEEKERLKQWKREKAKETAKEIGINLLCGLLNGFVCAGRMVPTCIIYPTAPPVRPEDLLPKKRY